MKKQNYCESQALRFNGYNCKHIPICTFHTKSSNSGACVPPQPRSRSWRVIESEMFCTSLFLSLCFLRLLFVVTVSGYRNSDAQLCLAIPSLCSLRIPPLPPQRAAVAARTLSVLFKLRYTLRSGV